MASYEVLLEYLNGKHTTGQLTNFLKYLFTSNREIVSWQPIFISIFLTYRCNLNCDMCLTHSTRFDNTFGQKYSKDIDLNFYKQILNRYNKAFEVFLIGNGEPLLHEDLFAMIDYASDVMKMRVSACSNGILVGECVNKIINSKLNTLYISLNGHNSEEYQRMTGMRPDLFQNICENIKELANRKKEVKSKMNLILTIILDKTNYKDLNSMIKFTESLGVDGVNFFQFLPVDQEGFTAKERCLFNDDLNVVKLFSEMSFVIKNKHNFNVSLPPLLDKDMSNNRNCSVPFTHICIDGDGNVGGCSCQMLNLKNNENFQNENVWNASYFQTLRKRFLNSEYSLMQPCQRCYNNSSQKKALWHKR